MLNRGWSSFALITSILLGAVGQLFMRAGMSSLHTVSQTEPFTQLLQSLSPSLVPVLLWTFAGLVAYATSLLFWMVALKRFDLSYAYPLLSLSYFLVYIGASNWPLLHETTSFGKTLGIVIIIVGVICVTRSHRSTESS